MEVKERILRLLENAAEVTGFSAERRIRYGASATEQEIVHALTPPGSEEHVFAFLVRSSAFLSIQQGSSSTRRQRRSSMCLRACRILWRPSA